MGPSSARPRGAHVLEAVADVLAEDGLAGLSIRAVAHRGGVSVAQVQYYFRSRAELVRAGFDHVAVDFLAQLPPGDGVARSLAGLAEVLMAWLPLDEVRARRARVWLAYAAAAAVDEQLAADAAALDAQLRAWLSAQLSALIAAGEARADADPDLAASALLALTDGLTLHALTLPAHRRSDLVVGVLRSWFDDLRPPVPGR